MINMGRTVWKFKIFFMPPRFYVKSITTSSSKTAIFEALSFDFNDYLQFLKTEIHQKSKSRVSNIAKKVVFDILQSLQLISRKI